MRGLEKMKNNLEELKRTLETIRAKNYPNIPKEVIEEIVDIQFQNQDNLGKRQTETQKAITKYANMITPSGSETDEI